MHSSQILSCLLLVSTTLKVKFNVVILHQFLIVASVLTAAASDVGFRVAEGGSSRATRLREHSPVPALPHAVRSGFDTDEDEEAFPAGPVDGAEGEFSKGAEIPEGLPPDDAGPEASSSEAGEGDDQAASTATSPRRKKKAAAPRMRYSLFHYDLPRKLKRVLPKSPPEKPPEYSSPKPIHSPA